ncbi:murein hydrolase activator EnvC [Mechercharimyces sp. CAU 1602]|uniref:murein hydrolase activator EnvC family protein n=1 Tax=Mechercharimyces sp. CAU 1602 TaxID=2973933 RepID=UPI0021612066|nr:peptidoglycan DD-metalloendopeptidase family protein [Mechercharimyces sp. CAU 1602]MCS1352640.1 peptidoglycan DD-metalloendopeptidase family protein [Mechercharimyces sp. CAU 1602]
MKKRNFIAIIATVCFLSSTFPSSLSYANEGKEKIEDELQEIQGDKDKKQEDIKSIESNLDKQKKQLQETEQQIHDKQKEIDSQEEKLKKRQKQVEKYRKVLHGRLADIYKRGEMADLATLLEADSFSEFLSTYETILLVLDKDENLFEKERKQEEAIVKIKKKLEEEQTEYKKMQAEGKKSFEEYKDKLTKSKSELASIEKKENNIEADLQKIRIQEIKSGNFKFKGPMQKPANAPISSNYGWRTNPYPQMHAGIDYNGDTGDPIYAAAEGIVVRSEPASGYGYVVQIDHGEGIVSLYAHMWSWDVTVKKGEYVKKGQVIGKMGNNGQSTGSHLHFEVQKNNQRVNPAPYM